MNRMQEIDQQLDQIENRIKASKQIIESAAQTIDQQNEFIGNLEDQAERLEQELRELNKSKNEQEAMKYIGRYFLLRDSGITDRQWAYKVTRFRDGNLRASRVFLGKNSASVSSDDTLLRYAELMEEITEGQYMNMFNEAVERIKISLYAQEE